MTSKIAALAVGAAISLTAAAQASAAIVSVTYTGTVSGGLDITGVFGSPGASLDGQGFTARYVFDTTRGFTSSHTDASYTSSTALGGSAYGAESPALYANLTINGITFSIPGDSAGEIYGYADSSGFSRQYHQADGALHTELGWGYSDNNSTIWNESSGFGGLPGTIDVPFSMDTSGNATNSGRFSIDKTTVAYPGGIYSVDYAYGDLTPTHLSETLGAPEPASWALMLLGVFGIGAAARSRRKAAVA
jgi:hypothetical protein